MGDLISRQAAIDAVQQHREDVLGGYEYDEGVAFVYAAAHNHIIKVIKQLPSAERRGRWVVLGDQIENQTFDECKCSECGCVEYFNKGWKHFDYCPNCGARMEATE